MRLRYGLVALAVGGSALGACSGPARAPAPVSAPASAPAPAAPKRPLATCDDPARGRECVRAAFEVHFGSPERSAQLARSCRSGYEGACFFEKRHRGAEAARLYRRRACGFGVKQACSDVLRDGSAEARWVTRSTRLTTEEPTSVELIAHPGSRLLLLEVEGSTAFALLTAFATTDDTDSEDPLLPRQQLHNPVTEDSVVVSLPAAVLSEQATPLREPDLRVDARAHTPDAIGVYPSWRSALIAFHPEDATHWYKSRVGCERAIAEHPRVRLQPGVRGLAAVPLRLTGGC